MMVFQCFYYSGLVSFGGLFFQMIYIEREQGHDELYSLQPIIAKAIWKEIDGNGE